MLWVTMKIHVVGIFLLIHNSSSSEAEVLGRQHVERREWLIHEEHFRLTTSARANPTRCFMPPESSLG